MEVEFTNEILIDYAISVLQNGNVDNVEKVTLKRTGKKLTFEIICKEANGVEELELSTGGKMKLILGE